MSEFRTEFDAEFITRVDNALSEFGIAPRSLTYSEWVLAAKFVQIDDNNGSMFDLSRDEIIMARRLGFIL